MQTEYMAKGRIKYIVPVVLFSFMVIRLIKYGNLVELYHVRAQNVYIHSAKDTNFTKYDVGEARLKFLHNFKNPCFLEEIRDVAEPYGVYNNNRYVTYKGGNSYRKQFQSMRTYASEHHHRNGVIYNLQSNSSMDGLSFRLRCLPYFLLLGMAKSGTTDFYDRIISHPLVSGPIKKELNWWQQYRVDEVSASLSDYIDLFDKSINDILKSQTYNNANGETHYEAILGEFSPVTFSDERFWMEDPRNKDSLEPKYLKIQDLYSINPNAKLIVLLRNPVTRLYSSYNMFREGSAMDFHLRVLKSIEWYNNCTIKEKLPRRRCVYGSPPEMPSLVALLMPRDKNNRFPGPKMVANYSSEIRKGMYSVFARDWLKVFPRKNMLFLKTEEYSKDPLKVMNEEVYPFLKISQLNSDTTSEIITKQKVSNSRSYEPMLPETHKILEDFYAPFNEELVNILNDRKWYWRE